MPKLLSHLSSITYLKSATFFYAFVCNYPLHRHCEAISCALCDGMAVAIFCKKGGKQKALSYSSSIIQLKNHNFFHSFVCNFPLASSLRSHQQGIARRDGCGNLSPKGRNAKSVTLNKKHLSSHPGKGGICSTHALTPKFHSKPYYP